MKLSYQFGDRQALSSRLDAIRDTRELELPATQSPVRDGDWVLACFSAGDLCCSVAARVFGSGSAAHLSFEDRDWERLIVALNAPSAGRVQIPTDSNTAVSPSVLIVDHDEDTCHVVHALLTQAGYRPAIASSPDSAFAQLLSGDWRLVITDCEAAGMSSSLFCRRLRNEKRCSRLPVLLMSARDESEVARNARSIGANDFIIKPFRAPELIARSSSLLDGAHTHHA